MKTNKMRQAIEQAALGPAQPTADGGERTFRFGADFVGFGGHFPGYPILPAILQTLLAQLVAEEIHSSTLEFRRLDRAKFSRELRPGEAIRVQVRLAETAEGLSCRAELDCAGERASSFQLKFAAGGSA